jgi:hypothetical protein
LGNALLSPLLWGGVFVVAMVFVRAVAVWARVGKPATALKHDHSHEHDHISCAHEHAKCDHQHDHGWAPWRYVILLLPVGLYSLGLIPTARSSHAAIDIGFDDSGTTAAVQDGEMIQGFLELDRAAATEQSRKEYAGRTAQVVGQVTNAEARRFGLVRYKIGCCDADAIPLNMRVIVPDTTPEGKAFDARPLFAAKRWVEVTGVIQFRKLAGSDQFVTVLEVPASKVQVVPQPAKPYLY